MPNRVQPLRTTQVAPEQKHASVYLDCAATTPMTTRAKEAWLEATDYIGNPSSTHGHGVEARRLLDQARKDIAACLDCPPQEIIFTSGGTESNALAVIGRVLAGSDHGGIVTTATEHSSLLGATDVAQRLGWHSHHIAPDGHGIIDVDTLLSVVSTTTRLVSVHHANNETGVLQPIADIAAELHHRGSDTLLHSDAVHTVGKVDLHRLPAMLLSGSAHKFGGPRGVGFLRIPGGIANGTISAVARGGAQEFGLRAGTENVPGIVASAAALVESTENLATHQDGARSVRKIFIDTLSTAGWRPTSPALSVTTTLSGWFPGVRGDTLMYALDQHGISMSTGSACHSENPHPSHVLTSMDLAREQIDNTVRLSFSGTENLQTIHEAANTIVAEVRRLQLLGN